jgi:hypothetical protein
MAQREGALRHFGFATRTVYVRPHGRGSVKPWRSTAHGSPLRQAPLRPA